MRIVFLSHTHMGGTFVVGSHQLANELSRAGHRVAHVSTPVTPFHLARSRDAEVRERYRQWLHPTLLPNGVLSVVPFAALPWPVAARTPVLWRHYGRASYGRIRRLVRRHLAGAVDLAVVDQPRLIGLATALAPAAIIYRPTDLYAQMPGGSSVADAETLAVERSAAVVATSEAVARHIRTISVRPRIVVLPNGVELRHFTAPTEAPPEYADRRSRRAVYVGALDERFDVGTVHELADRHPDVDIVLIGPSGSPELDRLRGCPNVQILGPRPYASVPAYLQHADLGLLPLSDHPANTGRSPMKLYEYGAAGLPVLARHTDEIAGRQDPFVFTYRDGAEAAEEFGKLMAQDWPAATSTAAAGEHSWEVIAQRLLDVARSPQRP